MPKKKKGQGNSKRKSVMVMPKVPELTVPSATAMVIAEIDHKIEVETAKIRIHEQNISKLRLARTTVAEIPTVTKRHPAAPSPSEKVDDKHLDVTVQELSRAHGVLPPGAEEAGVQQSPVETKKTGGSTKLVSISNQGQRIIRRNFCGPEEPAANIDDALQRAYGPKWKEHDFVEMLGPGRVRTFKASDDLKDPAMSVLRRQLLTGAAVLQRTQGTSPKVKDLRKEIQKCMPLEKVEHVIQDWFKKPQQNHIQESDNPDTWSPPGDL